MRFRAIRVSTSVLLAGAALTFSGPGIATAEQVPANHAGYSDETAPTTASAHGLKIDEEGRVSTSEDREGLEGSQSKTLSLSPEGSTELWKPSGKELKFVNLGDSHQTYVADTDGKLIGTYRIVSARTNEGDTANAYLKTQDNKVLVESSSKLPTQVIVEYGSVASSSNDKRVARESVILPPSEYVFDPNRGSLHDYCTSSPDEFPNPFGDNAPFHGPCANHDLCIERAGYHDRGCDGPLRDQMKNNCRATYGGGPTRVSCEATADVYFGAVTAASYF